MVSAEESPETAYVINLDSALLDVTERFPEGVVVLGWPRQQEGVDVGRQKEASIGEPERPRVFGDWFTPRFLTTLVR